MSFGTKAAQRLTDKIVLITGASSGIGEATSKEFAAATNGAIKLILTARRKEKLDTLSSQLRDKYPSIKVHLSQLDVSVPLSIDPFFNLLPKEFADIDILVNNAGKALGRDVVGSISEDDLDGMVNTNITGVFRMTQKVMPIFQKKNSGDFVNIGSTAGRDSYPGGAIYCATKAALRYFTESLRKETINTGIRVLEVDPGAVETEFSVVRFHGDKEAAKKVYEGTEPLTPEDIAEIILFGVSRRRNTVIAETLVFPNHQASSNHVYRKPPQ